MSITVTPFLRNVLFADALVSGAAGILMMLGAPLLSPLLGLPQDLLFWAGLALVPSPCWWFLRGEPPFRGC